MPELFPPTLTDLVACAEREVAMRRRVYPRRVHDRKMSQQLADAEIAKMEAIAEKLRELAESE
jgi:hypothetical protein